MQRKLYVFIGVLLVPTVGLVGDILTDGKFVSTTESGPPLEVASGVWVPALNADRVDGYDADAFALTSNTYTKAEVDALVAAAAAADSRRWYYLTSTSHPGGDALTACDSGFHMASIYEILDVSNLRYDAVRGITEDDSGSGPPATFGSGWVRTGQWSSGGGGPGLANCLVWTSSELADQGTVASLDFSWDLPSIRISPWTASTPFCSVSYRVWCIED